MDVSTQIAQPLPFGLERERHIEMLFRTFHNRWKPSIDPEDLNASPAQREAPFITDLSTTSEASGPGTENGDKEQQCIMKTLPADLAALKTVSKLHITARPELQGPQCISRRIYSITTETKQQLFVAVEESSCVCMQCCGPARSCTLQGYDMNRQHVFLFERPLRSDMCCLGCCLMEMRAYTATRELIGTVHQRVLCAIVNMVEDADSSGAVVRYWNMTLEPSRLFSYWAGWSMFTPYFEVCDSEGYSSVSIQGTCCPIRCLSDQEFQVVSIFGEHIGTVWKKWPGYNESCNMDHEHFGLEVPQNMYINTKVLLLAATFLLNHMFFEMS